MKKVLVLLSIIIIYSFTACSKTEKKPINSEKKEWEELEKVYSYKTPFVFSQDRIDNSVKYIQDIDVLVDESINIISERMQRGYHTGNWEDGVWTSWSLDNDIAAFDGKGYYICRLPITTYNNNRNALLESFTVFIFNEDMSITGKATFSDFNNKKLKVDVMIPNSDDFIIPKEKSDMEFINIHINYNIYGDDISNPSGWSFASYPLGNDNIVYANDYYSGKVKELNKLNLFKGRSWIFEGDVFHSLPEEMRYSYDKIMDNLIWVEYQ